MSARGCWSLMIACLSVTSCATIGTRPARTTTRVVGSTLSRVASSQNPSVTQRQEGSTVSVLVMARCDEERQDLLENKSEVESFNASKSTDAWFVAGGGAMLILGGATLADSARVYPRDTSSRTYNEIGPSNARLIGIGEILLGAGLATVAVVDAFRASATDERVERSKSEPRITRAGLPCDSPTPAPGIRITLSAKGESIDLGETDQEGRLTALLTETVPKRWVVGPVPVDSATVLASGWRSGSVGLRAVTRYYDDSAWAGVTLDRCTQATRADACERVAAYVHDFPQGAHAEEARIALKSAADSLARLQAEQQRLVLEEEHRVAQEQAERERQERMLEQRQQAEAERDERRREAMEKAQQAKLERAAKEQAQRATAQRECRRKCEASCAGDSACTSSCVAGACK